MALRTKSVSSPIDKEGDGLRILAARSTGMFVRNSRYDVWMPNLGPSESIREKLGTKKVSWDRFLELYEQELFSDGGGRHGNSRHVNHGQKYTLRLLKKLSRRGQNVTLLCHCDEDESCCHRYLLRDLILRSKL